MNLNVSASYQPDENEVWVDFRSDLSNTPTTADSLQLDLLIETKDQVGAISYQTLSTLKTNSDYLRPDRNYEVTFRNPSKQMDLWIQATATYGNQVFIKKVPVGQALPSHVSMNLPDNALYEKDTLVEHLTGGGEGNTLPNENIVILAPELRDFVSKYDFTLSLPIENYEPLQYQGGGDRLLIQNQTGQFELQNQDQAPWSLSSFLFLEPETMNLALNGFFLNTVLQGDQALPVSYAVDAGAAFFLSSVAFDYAVSAAAKIWKMRFTQNNGFSAFNEVSVSAQNTIAIYPDTPYTFSTYAKVKKLNKTTKVTKLTLALRWFSGATFLSESSIDLTTDSFSNLSLASHQHLSPSGADHVQPVIRLGSLDNGDDVELSLLGLQLEQGAYPTTRVQSQRLQDIVTLPSYNPVNQKIRFEMIMGFDSGLQDVNFTSGPLQINFLASGQIQAALPDISYSVQTPLAFVTGDLIDITVEHETGKKLAIYRDGNLLADTVLPSFTAASNPLTINGVGIELIRLSVFSRRGS